jgi:glycerophosphoryl diester phosphodiesterase
MPRTPPVIAHRGAAAIAPENTLASFRRAAELGARWIEFDCQLTADKVPVVIHDLRLGRTTTGRGKVCRCDSGHLRTLDAGAWFSPDFSGERVPTLAEVLADAAALGLGVNIELKPAPGQEEETARLALRVAAGVWPDHAPPPLVSSFARASLMVARRERPDWPRGLLSIGLPRDWRSALRDLDCATLNLAHQRLTPERVAAVRTAGYAVLAYTVNDPDRARELWRWGVASVFTDDPQRLLAVS